MATFDKLAADQRAIIELVLQRGQSYDDLSDMLGMPTARVRGLARDALAELAPATARRVDEDWRGQVADYLLLQQSGPEATATRGHLRRSEAARAWALSLLDSLDELYGSDDRPEIPEADPEDDDRERTRVRERARPTTRPASRPSSRERSKPRPARDESRPLGGDAGAAVRRRRIAAGAGVAALLLFAILIFPIGVLTGDDDEGDGDGANTTQTGETPVPVGNPIPLRALRNERGEGVAVVAQRGNERVLIVTAAGLSPTEASENRENPGTAYEVWLYNSKGEAQSVGAQVTDEQGNYQGAGPLPDNFDEFRFIDVSRERIDDNAEHSGDSVLRGRVADLTAAAPQEQGGGTGTQPAP
ncbi:MAG TPA: anti-sigma factor [Thermoleophilaceae bacterium]|nr:anti-sigma factor [Thermoleophilaceae bacterium]